ncbi:hypothetical protein Poli38472_007727 [Pythium oligandrum]|uniref:Metalloendopeptidase n=1 Tax=Pythium oligandrum TaxID=41045 RepID=A0A8K1FLB0_PYTOL|nr:hypothetical protein Poli38472_007727 [Pythium oligandrum]|eukprot:TMW68055.1 hypothetical protein Poli38472_007727 [Pythium oligandrum]
MKPQRLVAVAVSALAVANASCSIGDYQFDGLAHYIAGKYRAAGSIYADCIDGKAVCRLDDGILDSPDQEVTCSSIMIEDTDADDEEGEAEDRRRLGIYLPPTRVWPQRVVCVHWTEAFPANLRTIFDRAFYEYHSKADIFFTDIKQCRAQYGRGTKVCNNCQTAVKLSHSASPACYASLGYAPQLYESQLNLGSSCPYYKIAVHELGHVVGLIHEHAHPQRQVIAVRDKIRANSVEYAIDQTNATTAYDRTSIMHYPTGVFCVPRDPSLTYCDVKQTETDGCVVPTDKHCDHAKDLLFGQSRELTAGDVATINKLYANVARHPKTPLRPKPKPAVTVPITTFSPLPSVAVPVVTPAPLKTSVPPTPAPCSDLTDEVSYSSSGSFDSLDVSSSPSPTFPLLPSSMDSSSDSDDESSSGSSPDSSIIDGVPVPSVDSSDSSSSSSSSSVAEGVFEPYVATPDEVDVKSLDFSFLDE